AGAMPKTLHVTTANPRAITTEKAPPIGHWREPASDDREPTSARTTALSKINVNRGSTETAPKQLQEWAPLRTRKSDTPANAPNMPMATTRAVEARSPDSTHSPSRVSNAIAPPRTTG